MPTSGRSGRINIATQMFEKESSPLTVHFTVHLHQHNRGIRPVRCCAVSTVGGTFESQTMFRYLAPVV